MDVTKDEDVNACAAVCCVPWLLLLFFCTLQRVARENPDGLYCLVSNAGVLRGAPIEFADMELWRAPMEVNYFGAIRVVQGTNFHRPGLFNGKLCSVLSPDSQGSWSFCDVNVTAWLVPCFSWCIGLAVLGLVGG